MKIYMFIIGLFVCCSAGATAFAQKDDAEAQAKELFKRGAAEFKEGNFEQARDAFEKANELHPSWQLYYNIAQCEAELGRYGKAVEAYEKGLAGGGNQVGGERRDAVLEELAKLREMVGNLAIDAPGGLTVFVDGEKRAVTPVSVPIRLTAAKSHKVQLAENETVVHEEMVALASRQSLTLRYRPEEPKAEPAAEPALTTMPVEPETPAVESSPEPSEGLRPLYFWIGVGSTAAFGAGTIAMAAVSRSKLDDGEEDPQGFQTAGIVFLAMTGAAAITSGVLALFTDFDFSAEDESGGASARFGLAPYGHAGGGGLLINGRF